MAETPKKETIEVVLKNWRAEVETAQVYRDLAARESDAGRFNNRSEVKSDW